MFIVYRLQIQQNYINNAISNLQNYMIVGRPGFYSHLTKNETIKQAENAIENFEKERGNHKKLIEQLEAMLKKGEKSQLDFNKEKDNILLQIENVNQRISRFQERVDKIVDRENWRYKIEHSAFVTILYLISLFCLSLIGLIYSNYFSKNIFDGNMYTISILCLLLGGLANLVICCAISLDLGKPRI